MNVIARHLKSSDVIPINNIFERQPELGVPSLNNMVINAVMEDEDTGEIVAYGVVKIFAEATLIMDRSKNKKMKALALIEAMKTAILYSRDAGVEMLYAISTNANFTKCLKNRYKFKEVPGTLLCLNLDVNPEE